MKRLSLLLFLPLWFTLCGAGFVFDGPAQSTVPFVPNIFGAGFEANNLTEMSGSVSTNATVEASGNAKHRGNYGARITFDGSGDDGYIYKTITPAVDIYIRAYVRFGAAFTLANFAAEQILAIYDGATLLTTVYVQKDLGSPYWASSYQFGAAPVIYSGGSQPAFDGSTWYRIEEHFTSNPDTAQVIVYANDVLVWDSGVVNNGFADHPVSLIRFGGITIGQPKPGAGSIIDLDDLAADSTDWIAAK